MGLKQRVMQGLTRLRAMRLRRRWIVGGICAAIALITGIVILVWRSEHRIAPPIRKHATSTAKPAKPMPRPPVKKTHLLPVPLVKPVPPTDSVNAGAKTVRALQAEVDALQAESKKLHQDIDRLQKTPQSGKTQPTPQHRTCQITDDPKTMNAELRSCFEVPAISGQ